MIWNRNDFFKISRIKNKGELVADYFTKPLQGRLYKFMRGIIMGYESTNELWLNDGQTTVSQGTEKN